MWALLSAIVAISVFGPVLWVRWVMFRYRNEDERIPGTGAELAQHLARRFEIDLQVEETEHGDHYDPAERVVRLSADNFRGHSLTAVAVATHEVGHAIQHHRQESGLDRRTRLAPIVTLVAQSSSAVIVAAPFLGMLLHHPVPFTFLVTIGMAGLLARVVMHAVTLPVEWDASFGKALPILQQGDYITSKDEIAVRRILRAAALTYVAAALADVLNLFRWAALLLRR